MADPRRDALEAELNKVLTPEKAYTSENPFAQRLSQRKEKFVADEMTTWKASHNGLDANSPEAKAYITELQNRFDKEMLPDQVDAKGNVTRKGLLSQYKQEALDTYDGKYVKKEDKDLGLDMGDVAKSGLGAALSGGNIFGAMFDTIKAALVGILLKLEPVKDFIGVLTGYTQNKILGMTSGEKPKTWDEIKAEQQQDKYAGRLGSLDADKGSLGGLWERTQARLNNPAAAKQADEAEVAARKKEADEKAKADALAAVNQPPAKPPVVDPNAPPVTGGQDAGPNGTLPPGTPLVYVPSPNPTTAAPAK